MHYPSGKLLPNSSTLRPISILEAESICEQNPIFHSQPASELRVYTSHNSMATYRDTAIVAVVLSVGVLRISIGDRSVCQRYPLGIYLHMSADTRTAGISLSADLAILII